MARKSAKGSGTIRKKTVTRNGKEYTYWEARITTGRDPGTGKQLQRSFTGKTQKEVREKMQAAAVAVNEGTYTAPQRMTVGQWLDVWASDYLGAVKLSTADGYIRSIKNHLKPALGAIRLDQLRPHDVQGFVNGLEGLAPSTARYHHQVLHTALEKAVELDYTPRNPAARCELPRVEQEEVHPLDDQQAAALLAAAKDTNVEHLLAVALFTGLRMSELLGLTWDAVNFTAGLIRVNKQENVLLQRKEVQPPCGRWPQTRSTNAGIWPACAWSCRRALRAGRRSTFRSFKDTTGTACASSIWIASHKSGRRI